VVNWLRLASVAWKQLECGPLPEPRDALSLAVGGVQDGMLKNKSTYEIIEPSKVGIYRAEGEAGIVMGKHSGRHALKTRMAQLGVNLEGEELMDVRVAAFPGHKDVLSCSGDLVVDVERPSQTRRCSTASSSWQSRRTAVCPTTTSWPSSQTSSTSLRRSGSFSTCRCASPPHQPGWLFLRFASGSQCARVVRRCRRAACPWTRVKVLRARWLPL
jgi:hypothetical protein